MKKNILLSSLLFAALFLGVNSAQAAPPPGHGGGHGAPHNRVIHKAPAHHSHINHHMHHAPSMHHHHHVRHSRFISPCYCPSCYPLGYYGTNIYYPMHHRGHWGASFHITL